MNQAFLLSSGSLRGFVLQCLIPLISSFAISRNFNRFGNHHDTSAGKICDFRTSQPLLRDGLRFFIIRNTEFGDVFYTLSVTTYIEVRNV